MLPPAGFGGTFAGTKEGGVVFVVVLGVNDFPPPDTVLPPTIVAPPLVPPTMRTEFVLESTVLKFGLLDGGVGSVDGLLKGSSEVTGGEFVVLWARGMVPASLEPLSVVFPVPFDV